ncbi:MAG: TonB-dependent receptor [Lysobacteraceae bacterium]|nr:MAG: TonB-dependent receptor [Xanthomonadaceae bacterium]
MCFRWRSDFYFAPFPIPVSRDTPKSVDSAACDASLRTTHHGAVMSFRSQTLAAAVLAALPLCCHATDPVGQTGQEGQANPTDLASSPFVFPKVVVENIRASIAPARWSSEERLATDAAMASDTAAMLDAMPGVFVNQAGGVSGLPSIRGLADDRLRILVDGVEITASCPNHMNPALSYVAPGEVARIVVYPGIAPVSKGGDSIGGSIVIETAPPSFSAAGEGWRMSGELGAFYRSNGEAYGANASAVLTGERFRARYAGSTARADDYRAGGDFKDYAFTGRAGHALERDEVGSTGFVAHNQKLELAYRWGEHLLEAKLGWQSIPEQGFPNQRMDLTDNRQDRFNLRYLGDFEWGRLELRGYRETLDHAMDFGADKRYWYGMASGGASPTGGQANACAPLGPSCAAGMPMITRSETSAFSADAELKLDGEDALRIGLEHRRYRLDDVWPPSGAMMWPGEFWNIRDGRRDRAAAYAEWERHIGARSVVELGVRHERVRTDAGEVRGYDPASNMMASYQMRDAALFNARDRARSDANWDASAIFRYAHDARTDLALGLARKTRSPGLYERYPWSTWSMAAVMNNFVGDGNGYIGNPDLRPERAVTVSATLDWHAQDRRWEMQFTPYYTRIADYIDAQQWNAATNAPVAAPTPRAFVVLRYLNQHARMFGFDLSGKAALAETDFGAFGLEGELSWSDPENTRSGDNLYHQMPLHGRLTLTQRKGGWRNALEVVGVDRKDSVSRVRNEVPTAGYGLVNLRLGYEWPRVRVDLGVDNLFDRLYALPTGGAYLGQGTTMSINPPTPNYPRWGVAVPGPGRSIQAAVKLTF